MNSTNMLIDELYNQFKNGNNFELFYSNIKYHVYNDKENFYECLKGYDEIFQRHIRSAVEKVESLSIDSIEYGKL